MKPLKMRLEALQKLQAPKTAKDCKLLAEVVNYLSMFCPNLQKNVSNQYII